MNLQNTGSRRASYALAFSIPFVAMLIVTVIAQAEHFFKICGGRVPLAVVVGFARLEQGRAEGGGLVDVGELQVRVADDEVIAQPGDGAGGLELPHCIALGAEDALQLTVKVIQEDVAVGLVQHGVGAVGLDGDIGEGARSRAMD